MDLEMGNSLKQGTKGDMKTEVKTFKIIPKNIPNMHVVQMPEFKNKN